MRAPIVRRGWDLGAASGEEGDEGLPSTQEAEVGAWVVDWKGAILMEGREGVKFGACGADLWPAGSSGDLAIRILWCSGVGSS